MKNIQYGISKLLREADSQEQAQTVQYLCYLQFHSFIS